jgi:hypothetical protein
VAVLATGSRLVQGTGSTCQAALPAFEGAIRKRPLAVQDEGSSTALVTCGFHGHASRQSTQLALGLANTTGERIMVTCTLVHAWASFAPQHVTRNFNMGPHSEAGGSWNASIDNGGTPFSRAAASCALPPGIGITYVRNEYQEDIGN